MKTIQEIENEMRVFSPSLYDELCKHRLKGAVCRIIQEFMEEIQPVPSKSVSDNINEFLKQKDIKPDFEYGMPYKSIHKLLTEYTLQVNPSVSFEKWFESHPELLPMGEHYELLKKAYLAGQIKIDRDELVKVITSKLIEIKSHEPIGTATIISDSIINHLTK